MKLPARIIACIALASCGLMPAVTTATASAATAAGAGHAAAVSKGAPLGSQATAGTQAAGGTMLWAALYKGSNGTGQATAIAASPDGSRVFVTGLNGDSPPHEFYGTVAYNPVTGARLWTASYRSPAGANLASAIAVSPDGSKVFVTGASAGGYATVAYAAATGAMLWTARYSGPAGGATPAAVAVSPDGSTVFVTGNAATTGSGLAYATVAYAAATGATLWTASYGIAGGISVADSLAVSPDGSTVFVTGIASETSGVRGWATIAYAAATGAQLWVARYNGPVDKGGVARSVAVSPDGSTVVVTGSATQASGAGYATLAYAAATGATRWTALYNGPFGAGPDTSAYSVAVSPDGSKVFITGASEASSTEALTAYATVAYDAATGATLWVARYNGPAEQSSAVQLVVSPDGSQVFVTGSTVKVFGNLGEYQYATVAYSTVTGGTLWLRLYPNSDSGGSATGIAESPDGSKVFVTGATARPSAQYGTVAYSTG